MRNFLLLFILLLFTACSNKNYDLDNFSEKIKKIDLFTHENKKIIFIVQFLDNELESIEKKTQKFYLSVYFTEKVEKMPIKITLNDKVSLNIKPLKSLSKESIKFKNINPWAEHFIVEFEEIQEKKLNLKIEYSSNLVQLDFEK